ncbi:MAG: beta-lactamase family protein [Alphaproteobacteria bacterium]|nr:beta-lactamase family protein [Alphaproteobacteria bacterium]
MIIVQTQTTSAAPSVASHTGRRARYPMRSKGKSQLFFGALALASALVLGAPSAQAININKMKQNMVADLNGTVNGYAFVITRGNRSRVGSGGWAKRPVDGGVAMTINTRSFIASTTKPITAIATLQLLAANNLTLASKIAPWLPNNWVKGPGINQLTFRDLLQHRTGFNQIFMSLSAAKQQENWGNDWDGLKWIVKNGAQPGASASYKNANFALLRVIIPKLWKASGANDADFTGVTKGNNGLLYVIYVTNHIFKPSNVAIGASCTAGETYRPQALGYDVTEPNENGTMSETSWPNCGGHAGLRLSARDLSRIMVALRKGKLLTPPWRFAMDQFRLGWDRLSNTSKNGRKDKWWHGGAWNKPGNRGYRACIMKYKGNVEAALVINSKTSGKGACTILKDAYNNAG